MPASPSLAARLALAAPLAALLATPPAAAAAPGWEPVVAGLERRADERGAVATEALRIDPRRLRLRVVLARDLGRPAATAREFAQASSALAAVNGGFFGPDLRPVGLRVSAGRRVAGELRPQLGALVVARGKLRIALGSELERTADLTEVVQCGPRLVIGGRANRLKPQASRRTAAGIDPAGRLVVVVTRRGLLEASELASWLLAPEDDGGFGLRDALALDGGGSSQLYLHAGAATVDVPGSTPVADALVVLP